MFYIKKHVYIIIVWMCLNKAGGNEGSRFDADQDLTLRELLLALEEKIEAREVVLNIDEEPRNLQAASTTTRLICEGRRAHLSCPDGKGVLNIIAANYGRTRPNKETIRVCPGPTHHEDMQCCAQRSLEIVQRACNGVNNCRLTSNNGAFGEDPCEHTYKYLNVTYVCEVSTTRLICEGRSAHLSCPDGNDVLNIIAANYGRTRPNAETIRVCPGPTHHEDMQCYAQNSLEIVQRACNGVNNCRLRSYNGAFGGDPCEHTYKYLNVTYVCEGVLKN